MASICHSKYDAINQISGRARAQLFVNTSIDAASYIQPEELDFVFIDGDHSYRAVEEDLAAWEPLVKKGGIVAGHDFGSIDDVVLSIFFHDFNNIQKHVKI